MTTPSDTRTAARDAVDTNRSKSKAAYWIDDPFGSVITGIVFPAAAVSLAIVTMWTLASTLA